MSLNIKVIAEKAGVSTATVSRVLSGFPGVREKTKKKVMKITSDLNYEVDGIARSLRQKKTYKIGVIVGNVLSQFYSILAKSIEDVAIKYGYSVILCNGDDDPEKELNYLKVLRSSRVDGIIIAPTGKNADYVNSLMQSNIKIVLVDRLIEGVDCDAILVDNEKGAYTAVKYLIDKGYKKIAIIDGFIDRTTGKERLKGYLRALNENNIPRNDDFIKIKDFKKRSGIVFANELLENKNKPEAIFAANLDLTIGVLLSIKNFGLKIPDDIAVIGFDDSDWAQILDPPLTVISQPVYDLGATTAEMLIKNIENNNSKKEKLIVTLNTKLIERDSVKNK
ncbi:MAG: LacI family DNA-binding transcriptional regulator [Candidatus Humimicrobiaceae bacterium]